MRSINMLLGFVLVFISLSVSAEKKETFILQGKIENFKKDMFLIEVTGYFKYSTHQVKVDKAGNFSQEFFIDGIQDVKAILNEQLVSFFASPGDNIILRYDEKDFKNTFKLISPFKVRSRGYSVNADPHSGHTDPSWLRV